METLRALAAEGGTASLTDQAQHKAHSALVAIEGITAHEIEGDGGGGENARHATSWFPTCVSPPPPRTSPAFALYYVGHNGTSSY
jgi:hypothetical protein